MIRVTKVLGESFDLETKEETPKALILSNGIREFQLYIDDATAMAIIAMIQEEKERLSAPLEEEPVPVKKAKRKLPPEFPPEFSKPKLEDAPVEVRVATVEEMPEEAYESEDREPGEEYNDFLTGAGSL